MIELDDAVEIRDLGFNYLLEEKLNGLIKREGQKYRMIEKPVTIEIIKEPREIPASSMELYYSDGDAPNRVVPAGTILIDGKYTISEDILRKNYERFLDDDGNVIPGKYVKKTIITALKNPFGKKVRNINGNGWLLNEYDVDCYFIINSYGKVNILSKEDFEKRYANFDESKNNDIDIVADLKAQETEVNIESEKIDMKNRKNVLVRDSEGHYILAFDGEFPKMVDAVRIANEIKANHPELADIAFTYEKMSNVDMSSMEIIVNGIEDTRNTDFADAQKEYDDMSKSDELLSEINAIKRGRHFSDETKDELIRNAENSSRIR